MAERRRVEQGYACAEVVQLASEYLEGAMTAEQMTRFELHLNLCDGCSSFLEQVRMTATLAGAVTVEQIPDDIKTKLLAAFRNWERE
jgi:hypothetical protein